MKAWTLLLFNIACWHAAVPAEGSDSAGSFLYDVVGQSFFK